MLPVLVRKSQAGFFVGVKSTDQTMTCFNFDDWSHISAVVDRSWLDTRLVRFVYSA